MVGSGIGGNDGLLEGAFDTGAAVTGALEGKRDGVFVPSQAPITSQLCCHSVLPSFPGSNPYEPQLKLVHSYTIPPDSICVPMS